MRCVVLLLLCVACSKPALEPDGCPKDLLGATGKSCDSDGKICTGGSSARALSCQHGTWTELSIAPPPSPAK